MRKNATYRNIPCWYDPETDELTGKNWFYDLMVEINLWFDFNILGLEEMPIWIDVDDEYKQ